MVITCALVLLLASACAAYLFAPQIRYVLADSQTRQRLLAERLQRGYTAEAKALEQQLRTSIASDRDVVARLQRSRSLPETYKQKLFEMFQGIAKSINESRVKHHLPEADLSDWGRIPVRDPFSIKEVQVNSVSDKPTFLRTNAEDLLQRYHADVTVTATFRPVEGEDTILRWPFIASATPEIKWTFPSIADVKQRVLAVLDERYGTAQREYEMELDKTKLEFEKLAREDDLKLDKQELQELQQRYRRP